MVLLSLCWPVYTWGQAPAQALLLEVTGVIGPATGEYIKRSLQIAQDRHAALVIVRMDTPGGLDIAMRQIIRDFIASPVPVVSYVAPSGARAASAGTYMLYASHIAAMAPATNLGAATPVQLGGPAAPAEPEDPNGTKPKKAEPGDAMSKKMVNDAVAYIRGLAQLRGRNAEWAEQAVREAASLSAEEALEQHVIDLIATDIADLLAKLDGRKVNVLGQERILKTAGLQVQRMEPDWRTRLLAVITDPNVAYLLMLIGIYGLIYEFANPGMVLPGVAGVVCLLLALLAFQVLPINYAGFALMLLGMAFIIAEVFMPSFGALGLGGVIAFAMGSIMLLDTTTPGFGISWALIAVFTLVSAGFLFLVVSMALRAHRRPVVSGREQMIGSQGEALEDFDVTGRVRVHGELWEARTHVPLRRGQRVRVTGLDGLTLIVKADTTTQAQEN
ncbi:MAG TPA: nodulation protein NfeD [Gammaproteobacteria bacterium]|nr:nodulation protein NfeD [Gammaproteobacteria bacterium]